MEKTELTLCKKIMDLLSQYGKEALELSFLHKKLNLSLDKLYILYPCKSSLVSKLQTSWEIEFLAQVDKNFEDLESPELRPEEILMELVLMRFDHHLPYKKAYEILWNDQVLNAQSSLATIKNFSNFIKWCLDIAKLDQKGPYGFVRTKVFLVIYAKTLQIWFDDDSKDMEKTISELDNYLNLAKECFPLIWKRG